MSNEARSVYGRVAGSMKKPVVVSGTLDLDRSSVLSKVRSGLAVVSRAASTPTTFAPHRDMTPSTRSVVPLPGTFGSIAAAQDVCAGDLRCVGVQSQARGSIALLYPGCSPSRGIRELVTAPGTTTWVASRNAV